MLKARVLKGTAILFAGRLSSQILGLASTMIATRLLFPEDFGLVAIAFSVFAIAGSLVELPVATALVQMPEARKSDFDTAWTLSIIQGLIVSVLTAAAAWPVALIFEDPRLVPLILAMAAYPAILGFRNSRFEIYIRELSFQWEALVEFGTKFASLALVIVVAWTTRSYWALPAGLLASGVTAVILSFALRPELPSLSLKEFRKFFGFSIWLGLGQIADSLWATVTTFAVGRMLGNSVLGLWSVGWQLGERMETLLFSPVERTLFAAFSSIQEQFERVRSAYLQSIRLNAAIALPICAGVSLLSEPVVALLFGPKFSLAALPVAIIAPTVAVYVMLSPAISLAIAFGRTRELFHVRLATLLAYLPMLAAGLHFGGLIGALWAGLASAIFLWALCLRLVSSILDIRVTRQFATVARSALATAVMVAAIVPIRAMFGDFGDTISIPMILKCGVFAAIGTVIFTLTHIATWQMSGRPAGIESFVLDLNARRPESLQTG